MDLHQLKHPVVLIHGLGAKSTFGRFFEYFHGIPAHLRKLGNRVLMPDLTAWHSIEHRARELGQFIEENLPDHGPEAKVNLIGHSMGGLDARYLVSKLGFADRVASITTIGTPNRGSVAVDVALGIVPKRAIDLADKLLERIECSNQGFCQVSTKYSAETFSHDTPNAPGVAYFSATSAIADPFKTALPIFWVPHRLIHRYEGDNDGFVSVESSKWGEHICTYVGDHYGQIGQFLGRSRGLDHYAMFEEIVGRLRREGF